MRISTDQPRFKGTIHFLDFTFRLWTDLYEILTQCVGCQKKVKLLLVFFPNFEIFRVTPLFPPFWIFTAIYGKPYSSQDFYRSREPNISLERGFQWEQNVLAFFFIFFLVFFLLIFILFLFFFIFCKKFNFLIIFKKNIRQNIKKNARKFCSH